MHREDGRAFAFDGVDVWLIKSTKQQLCTLPLSLGYIEGIRPYHKPSILTSSNPEKREWSELIKGEITYDKDADVIVGILDSGVNNAHELLMPALPDERMDVAIGVQETTDKTDHGTGMAGLALLGDLTNIAYQRETPVAVHHALSSVKYTRTDMTPPKILWSCHRRSHRQSFGYGGIHSMHGHYGRKCLQRHSHLQFCST